MFVRIAIDQTVSPEGASVLGRPHVEVAGLDNRELQSALRRSDLGRVDDGGELDIRVATLRRLGVNPVAAATEA